jgi:hypothetical protein
MKLQHSLFFYLVISCLTPVINLKAQGCSDAGFCTMGAMKPDQAFHRKVNFKLRSFELNQYYATTTTSAKISVTTADLTFGITEKTIFQAKLPYLMARGPLGNNAGVSDISLSLTQNLVYKENYSINATVGAKLPTNDANALENGRPLPMYYQTSLGTTDLVVGGSFITRHWLVAVGYQQAFGETANAFRWSDWEDYPNEGYILKYPISRNLRRGTDVMLRVERNWRFSNFNFNVGLLPIWRITKDQIFSLTNERYDEVEGSDGLALSLLAGGGYHFNVKSSVKLMFGRVLVQRETNPDGLSRIMVTTLAYVYRF